MISIQSSNQTSAILNLFCMVFALNPANTDGFVGAQQKAAQIRSELDPEDRVKFDDLADNIILAKNAGLPGRGFDSLVSGVSAPPIKPAPAVAEDLEPASKETGPSQTEPAKPEAVVPETTAVREQGCVPEPTK